jgi:erythromycin esterase-like protein
MTVAAELDQLLATRTAPPVLFGLGEPTHGFEAFPLLRNEILRHLVGRGYRSVVLETDVLAAAIVDDYVQGGPGELDEVLATGIKHQFGNLPSNRALVEWLRAHNAGLPAADRVRFLGCDGPLEYTGPEAPRHALTTAIGYLPEPPVPAAELAALLGPDADWTDERAMRDPAVSIGGSDRVRALRLIADDVLAAVHRHAPADPAGYRRAVAHARTAVGLLRYQAAMAQDRPDRLSVLFGLRDAMMAENLLAIVAEERGRGPVLVFANNAHLQRARTELPMGGEQVRCWSAGALAGVELGAEYLFVAADGSAGPRPGTVPAELAAAAAGRTLFAVPELPPGTTAGAPLAMGHAPLSPAVLAGADAVVHLTGVDGSRYDYWR